MRTTMRRRSSVALVAALVALAVRSPGEAGANGSGSSVVLANAGCLSRSPLAATAAAIREHAPRTWQRARENFGWAGQGFPTPAQAFAQALLENALGREPEAARTSKLYPYDNFLAWRLRQLSAPDIAQVRRELKPAARSWAAGSAASAGDPARSLRSAFRGASRQLHQAFVAERRDLQADMGFALGAVLAKGGVGPSSPSWLVEVESSWVAGRVTSAGRKLARWMDTARRVVVPPALRPRQIEKWLDALHGDLRLGLPWEADPETSVSLRVSSLRGGLGLTRNELGQYVFTPPEADTMLAAASRRLDRAARARADRGNESSVKPESVDQLRAVYSALEPVGDEIEAVAMARGVSVADDRHPAVQAIIEECLSRALATFTPDMKTLLDPGKTILVEDPQGRLCAGFWPGLKERVEQLEAILDADAEHEAWRRIVGLLERARGQGTTRAAP